MSAIQALTTAAIVLSCLLGSGAVLAAEELPAGTVEIDLDSGGHHRFFLMHVPPQAAAGDIYRYQGTDATTGAAQLRGLHIARLRAGVGAHYAVAAHARLEFELGIEGARIQDDVTTRRVSGGYLLGALVLGKGNDGREEYLSAD